MADGDVWHGFLSSEVQADKVNVNDYQLCEILTNHLGTLWWQWRVPRVFRNLTHPRSCWRFWIMSIVFSQSSIQWVTLWVWKMVGYVFIYAISLSIWSFPLLTLINFCMFLVFFAPLYGLFKFFFLACFSCFTPVDKYFVTLSRKVPCKKSVLLYF